MLDLALALIAVTAVARGLVRGAVRESWDVLVVVVATAASFRFGGTGGRVLESWSGASSLAARFMAAGVIFIALVVIGSHLGGVLAGRWTRELTPWSRALGGVFSLMWAAVMGSVVLLVAVALPLAESADAVLADSRAVAALTDTDSLSFELITALDDDRVLESMVNLDGLVGSGRIVIGTGGLVRLEGAGDIAASRPDAIAIFDRLNLSRIDAGVSPLAWSEALAEVADAHAFEMYIDGYFSHLSPATGTVADRVQAVGLPYVVVGENLALAPTVDNVHDGLFASPGHRANMLEPQFRRVGIGAYRGPYGLMVVQVFSG